MFALVLSVVGFTALALAMHRHHQQVRGRASSRTARLLLRLTGAADLGASLAVCVASEGWSNGPVLWFGLLSAAGLIVVLLLTYRSRIADFAASAIPIVWSSMRNH